MVPVGATNRYQCSLYISWTCEISQLHRQFVPDAPALLLVAVAVIAPASDTVAAPPLPPTPSPCRPYLRRRRRAAPAPDAVAMPPLPPTPSPRRPCLRCRRRAAPAADHVVAAPAPAPRPSPFPRPAPARRRRRHHRPCLPRRRHRQSPRCEPPRPSGSKHVFY